MFIGAYGFEWHESVTVNTSPSLSSCEGQHIHQTDTLNTITLVTRFMLIMSFALKEPN